VSPVTTSPATTGPPTTGPEHPGQPAAAPLGRVLLTDGLVAVVRPLAAGDLADLLALHGRLGERDRYLRFGTLHPADLAGHLERALAPGSGVLSLGARVRGRLVAAVHLYPLGDDAGEAALVVDPSWRDHGLGTALLEDLAAAAVRLGVRRFVAEVLAENGRMIEVLTDLGLPVDLAREDGVLHVDVRLHPDSRYAAASEDRYRQAAAAGLRAVLTPQSVAVVGAGRGEHSIGRAVLRSLRAAGFPGAVVAVNPHTDRIEDVPCWPSVAALPCTVDLAVVAVPVPALAGAVEQCGARGVRALVVLTSGVSGVPGLPERLRATADRWGMRLVGPNTVGVVGPGRAARLDTSFAPGVPPPGDVGLVAQSGGVAIAAVTGWARLGLGLSTLVSVGDAVDVGARDVLAWFDEDPGTALAVLHAEGEADLRGLVRTAAHLAARIPVLALRSGSSEAGRRAAVSHTARSVTARVVRDAAYTAGGIQAVDGLTDLAAAVGLLRGQPLPAGGTVAIVSNAGGSGVLAADACAAAGLAVDPLPDPVRRRLAAVLPPLAVTANPVDTGALVTPEQFAAALTALLDAPSVGAVLAVTVPTAVGDPADGVVAAATAAVGGGVPVIAVRPTQAEAAARLDLPGAPGERFLVSVPDPGTAARALAVADRRRAWLHRGEGRPLLPAGVDVVAARAVVGAVLARAPGGDWLRPPELDRLCRAAGLDAVPGTWVVDPAAAREAAAAVRGPVAVKGWVAGVLHKGDAGLLRLPVTDPAEAGRTVAEWSGRAGERWLGALVQPVVPPGDEFLVGAVRDPAAGPVVALGPGGRAADALGHRVHRLAPLTTGDVEEALEGTGLLGTAHGRGLYRAGIADALARVAWLADAVPEIAEVELNPLVVSASDARALDVRARVLPTG